MRTLSGSDQAIAGTTRFGGQGLMHTRQPRGPQPAFALNFLTDALSSAVAFSRASNATMIDSTGAIVLVENNIPRFDYDPVTLALRGLLIEEQRTNLVATSSTTGATNATNTPAPVDLKGQPTRRITGNGLDTAHFAAAASYTAAASTVSTISVFAKYVDTQYVQLCVGAGNGTTTDFVNFDLINGTVTLEGATATGDIFDCGGGVYRLTMTWTTPASPSGSSACVLSLHDSPTATRLAANTLTTFVDFFGMQNEVGAFATSLIPTTGTAATRAADNATAPVVGAAQYTLFAEVASAAVVSGSKAAAAFFADFNNYSRLLFATSATVQSNVGGTTLTGSGGAIAFGVPAKVAASFSGTVLLTARDGAVTDTDTGATFDASAVTTLNLGRMTASSTYLNGWLRRVSYYPMALTGPQLGALTS